MLLTNIVLFVSFFTKCVKSDIIKDKNNPIKLEKSNKISNPEKLTKEQINKLDEAMDKLEEKEITDDE